MARRSKESAGLILRKGLKGIFPASAFDQEQLERFAVGTEFRASSMTKRSLPQHRTYWKALSHTVEATGRWATPEHLHEDLKDDLGYWVTIKGLDGKPKKIIDSTAFDAMKQEDFQRYFDAAMARIAEATGFDPMGWLAAA